MGSDMTYVDKCWFIGKLQGNFSFNDGGSINVRDVNDIGIDFNSIKTLGLYMFEKEGNAKYLESEKLKNYTSFNATLPNGLEVTFTADNKGQGCVAQIEGYREITCDKTFAEIMNMNAVDIAKMLSSEGLEKNPEIANSGTPKTMKEFADRVERAPGRGERSALAPTHEEIEEKEQIKEEDYDPEKVKDKDVKSPEAEKAKTKSVAEVAAEVGVSENVIENFLKEHGRSMDSLIGAKRINDTQALGARIGKNMAAYSSVIMIKVRGENLTEQGFVITESGSEIAKNDFRVNQAAQDIIPNDGGPQEGSAVNDLEKELPKVKLVVNGQTIEMNSEKDFDNVKNQTVEEQERAVQLLQEKIDDLKMKMSGELENTIQEFYQDGDAQKRDEKCQEINQRYQTQIDGLTQVMGIQVELPRINTEQEQQLAEENAKAENMKDGALQGLAAGSILAVSMGPAGIAMGVTAGLVKGVRDSRPPEPDRDDDQEWIEHMNRIRRQNGDI